MSLLKYFTKAPHGDVSEAAVSDHDASADLPSEAESDESPLSLVTASPSLPLPPDSHARDIRICQGPYQPRLSKYMVTVHQGKGRSFCSKWYDFHNWLEYSPKTDRMCMSCICIQSLWKCWTSGSCLRFIWNTS